MTDESSQLGREGERTTAFHSNAPLGIPVPHTRNSLRNSRPMMTLSERVIPVTASSTTLT